MTDLFQNVLTASFHGSIVILAVILLRFLLKKTPKKFLCLLWLLAGIRLLMPFEIQSGLSLQPDVEAIQEVYVAEAMPEFLPAAENEIPQKDDMISDVPEQAPAENVELPEATWQAASSAEVIGAYSPEAAPRQEDALLTLDAIAANIWVVVAFGFVLYTFASYLRLKFMVREAIRIRGNIWECDRIETAFILGFIRPQVYLPMGMSKNNRRHILAHERTHLEKGDHWIKMIGFMALSIHWFNPLVWLAYYLLCKDIEMACDERVVQFMELEERKSYSAALLNCSTNHAHFAACPVAFGEVSVKNRVMSVLNYKKPSFWISLAGVIAIIFVAVCLVTMPTEEAAPAETPTEPTEQSLEETLDVQSRVQGAWEAVLSQERYHLLFDDSTYDGSVYWQVNFYKDGENTLWWSSDHLNKEGRMVLDGVSYKFIDGSEGGWVPYEVEDTLLEEMLAHFSLEGKEITDVVSHVNTTESGYTYETLSFHTYSTTESGMHLAQPMEVNLDVEGNMTGMRVENPQRKGADYFTFSNWSNDDSGFNSLEDVFSNARENLLSVEDVHPSKLQEPTQDEERMAEWGILFRVDDDLLTRYSGEAWFAQSNGYEMPVYTDNVYWLEKRTDTGWEKLPTIAEPEWEEASYTLGHDRYTSVAVDWTELYGPLTSGKYRMGKTFYMVDAVTSCVGYAEFDIYYNESNSADQKAAVERCYAELEELKQRETIHWLSNMGSGSTMEYWVNGEDYLRISYWPGPEVPEDQWSEHDKSLFPRTDTSVRYNGVGYGDVREDPDVPSSKVLGMGISTLQANRAGWAMGTIEEDFNMLFFERSNKTITFPEGVGVVSDEMVRFVLTWPVVGLEFDEASAQLTYRFDGNGDLCRMEYKVLYDDRGEVYSIEIYDTSAAEIDTRIRSYTENLVVQPFSWSEAKVKYTDEEFNIRETGFVNTQITTVSDPVTAAQLALKEYPNLGEYLSIDVYHDDTAGMWKVTIRSYVEYQSTEAFRDVYIADNGVTCLLVYEGPIGCDENRK